MPRRNMPTAPIAAAALLVALIATGVSCHRSALAREAAARVHWSAMRALTHDRLIGSRIDVSSLGLDASAWAGARSGRPSILWILDLERCFGCIDELGAWSRLEQSGEFEMFLFLIGETTPAVEARLRVLRRTVVTTTTRPAVQAALGAILPSTKVLLDPSGIALLVDSRASRPDCGWSFEAQVGALSGLNSPHEIRSAAPSPQDAIADATW